MQKLVADIMAAWRRAERLASSLPEGSPEHAAANRACEGLRDAYQAFARFGAAESLAATDAKLLLTDAAADVGRG